MDQGSDRRFEWSRHGSRIYGINPPESGIQIRDSERRVPWIGDLSGLSNGRWGVGLGQGSFSSSGIVTKVT
jgi:hypothetical protein